MLSLADESKGGGFLEGIAHFDGVAFGISALECVTMDVQQRLLLEVGFECLASARIAPARMESTGAYVGILAAEHALSIPWTWQGQPEVYSITGAGLSVASGRLAFAFGMGGPALSVDTACSSSLVALNLARAALLGGGCDGHLARRAVTHALACGSNALVSRTTFAFLHRAGMLAPDGRCKTLDASANGYVRAEAVQAIALQADGRRALPPTPVLRFTTAREALRMTQAAFDVTESLPASERDLIVYCSRKGAGTREVGNERELLRRLRAAYPNEKVVVYENVDDVHDLVALFRRAKVILGPHGAGLSHMLFAEPGTHVIEFQFMKDPPMMFWHLAEALQQDYWLLPVPNAWWMQREMDVPIDELLDVFARIDDATQRVCTPRPPPRALPATSRTGRWEDAAPARLGLDLRGRRRQRLLQAVLQRPLRRRGGKRRVPHVPC